MTGVTQSYNQMVALLRQYEVAHLQGWSRAAEAVPQCLSAALLVRHHSSKVFRVHLLQASGTGSACLVCVSERTCVCVQEVLVNLDPEVLQVLEEARWMAKLGLKVPKVMETLSSRGAGLRALHRR